MSLVARNSAPFLVHLLFRCILLERHLRRGSGGTEVSLLFFSFPVA
jgi:hypothetical protein